MTKSRNWLLWGRPDAIRLNRDLNEAFCLYVDAMVPLIETLLDSSLKEGDDWRAEIEDGLLRSYNQVLAEEGLDRDALKPPENPEWGPIEIFAAITTYWGQCFRDHFSASTRILFEQISVWCFKYHASSRNQKTPSDTDVLSTLQDIYKALRRASEVRDSISPKAGVVLALVERVKQELEPERGPSPLKGMTVGGFKAYAKNQYVPLKPITLIYGANSAGKSSILHALALANHIDTTGGADVHEPRAGGGSIDLGGFKKYARMPSLPDNKHNWERPYEPLLQPQVEIGFAIDTSLLPESWAPLKQSGKELLIEVRIDRQQSGLPSIAGLSIELDSEHLLSLHVGDQSAKAELSFFNANHPGLANFINTANGWPIADHPDNPEASALIKSAEKDLEDSDELTVDKLAAAGIVIGARMSRESQDISTDDPEYNFIQSYAWAKKIAECLPPLEPRQGLFLRFFNPRNKLVDWMDEALGDRPHKAWHGWNSTGKTADSIVEHIGARHIPSLVNSIGKLISEEIRDLDHLGPVRPYPTREMGMFGGIATHSGEGYTRVWQDLTRNPLKRDRINQFIGDESKIRTPYELRVQSFTRIDNDDFIGKIRNIKYRGVLEFGAYLAWITETGGDHFADRASNYSYRNWDRDEIELFRKRLREDPNLPDEPNMYELWQLLDHGLLNGHEIQRLTADEVEQLGRYSVTDSEEGDVPAWGMQTDIEMQVGDMWHDSRADQTEAMKEWVQEELREIQQTGSGFQNLILFDKKTEAELSLSDVGFGLCQTIPVLFYLDPDHKGLVSIEQPESQLHPAGQAELGDSVLEGALGGNRQAPILIETHSEHLILRILRRIRETTHGELPDGCQAVRPEDVAVLYVEPTTDEGTEGSDIIEIPITEDGEFGRAWPSGFFPERFKELF